MKLKIQSWITGTCMLFMLNATAQKVNPASIVGTWKLIEFTDLDSATNTWNFSYGKQPRGYFTYTKSGVVSINISTDNPLKISAQEAKQYSVNLNDYIQRNSFGYFGTYTVEAEKSTVIHHVKGGTIPWYVDTDQPRPFILKGDTLMITDNKTHRRVMVRVD
jgi:hypothetical protein